jgi:hypothetical protein
MKATGKATRSSEFNGLLFQMGKRFHRYAVLKESPSTILYTTGFMVMEIQFIRYLVKKHSSDTTTEISGDCNNGSFAASLFLDPLIFPFHLRIFSNQRPRRLNECGSCPFITGMRNVPHANMFPTGIL